MRLPPLGPKNGSAGPLFGEGWDLAALGGRQLPGKWRVSGGKIKLKCDKKSKRGADGANSVFDGIDPQEFELDGTLWTDEQIAEFVDVCKLILPQPGQSQNQLPVQLQHPSVLHFGFAINIKVLGSSPLEVVGTSRKVKLYLQHWLPAKSGNATSQPKTTAKVVVKNIRSAFDSVKSVIDSLPLPPLLPSQQPGAGAPPFSFNDPPIPFQ